MKNRDIKNMTSMKSSGGIDSPPVAAAAAAAAAGSHPSTPPRATLRFALELGEPCNNSVCACPSQCFQLVGVTGFIGSDGGGEDCNEREDEGEEENVTEGVLPPLFLRVKALLIRT